MPDNAIMPAEEMIMEKIEAELDREVVPEGLHPLDSDTKSKRFNTIKWSLRRSK